MLEFKKSNKEAFCDEDAVAAEMISSVSALLTDVSGTVVSAFVTAVLSSLLLTE